MARTKKTEAEKNASLIKNLKICGLFVSIIGIYIFIVMCATSALGEVSQNVNNHFALTLALQITARNQFVLITIFMSIYLIYEVLNYLLYMFKEKTILLASIVIEMITLIVLGIILNFISVQIYVLLLPIISGILNYCVLLLSDDE